VGVVRLADQAGLGGQTADELLERGALIHIVGHDSAPSKRWPGLVKLKAQIPFGVAGVVHEQVDRPDLGNL
jgi:hypothetical protein